MGEFQKWLNDVPRDATVAEAARRAVRSRLNEVVRLLPLAAREHEKDIEHVHRLRVTVRRSSAVLSTYEAVLPKAELENLARALKKVRKAAGPARDLDVFLERLADLAAPDSLTARLRKLRATAQADIVRVCEKLRGGEELQRLADAVTGLTPGEGKRARKAAKRPLSEWAPERLADAVEGFLSAIPPASPSPEALHQFRIEGKRVRYAIEALAPGLPSAARERAYPQVEELQERLGAINDHAVAAERISEWLDEADKAQREFLGDLIEKERARLQEKAGEFDAWWDEGRAAGVVAAIQPSAEGSPASA